MAPPPQAPNLAPQRRTPRTRPADRDPVIADPKPLAGDWLTGPEIIDLPVPAIQYKTLEHWRAGKRQDLLLFPEPDHEFGSVPTWSLSRVEAWFEATGIRYDLRVWRLKLELGSYRRQVLNQHSPRPSGRFKIPAKKKVPGDWVTIPEIADLPVPAVKVSTVEVWRNRHDVHSPTPFPVPDDYRGSFPTWRLERVMAWLELTGKPCTDKVWRSKVAADLYSRPAGKTA